MKNPNKVEVKDERTPAEIFDSIEDLSDEANELIKEILVWDLWPENNDDGLENLFAEPNGFEEDDEEDFLDFNYDALSDDDKQKIDALDEEIEALEKKLKEICKPINEQIDVLLEKKEIIYKKNHK